MTKSSKSDQRAVKQFFMEINDEIRDFGASG